MQRFLQVFNTTEPIRYLRRVAYKVARWKLPDDQVLDEEDEQINCLTHFCFLHLFLFIQSEHIIFITLIQSEHIDTKK